MVDPGTARDLLQTMESISKYAAETQAFLAKTLRLTYPQWSIVWAIKELDTGVGVSVGDAAKKLRVDPSFVTAQTKILEKKGIVHRNASQLDGRIILMSIDAAIDASMLALAPKQSALNDFIFAGFQQDEVRMLLSVCKRLESRIAKAGLLLEIDE